MLSVESFLLHDNYAVCRRLKSSLLAVSVYLQLLGFKASLEVYPRS